MGTSPVINEELLDFGDAMYKVITGKKMARKLWNNADYVYLKGDILTLKNDKGIHNLIVSKGDIEGEDWVVVG